MSEKKNSKKAKAEKLLTIDEALKIICGQTRQEYSLPVKQRIDELREQGKFNDRNDILRDGFNLFCRTSAGTLIPTNVARWYSEDLYSRVLAYELGSAEIDNLVEAGFKILDTEEPLAVSVREVAEKTNGVFSVLEHGCCFGKASMAMAIRYPKAEVVAYDIYNNVHYAVNMAYMSWCSVNKKSNAHFNYVKPSKDSIISSIASETFDLIISEDVLEHIADPVREINKLGEIAKPEALLSLSTFFNSCEGKDPSHLEEHALFQELSLWFAKVRYAGWIPYRNDPRGCLKVFKKEA